MPVLRSTALIDAPPRTVAGLLRDVELTAAALGRDGHRLARGPAAARARRRGGLRVRLLPGVRVPLRLVVGTVSEHGLTATLPPGRCAQLRHTSR